MKVNMKAGLPRIKHPKRLIIIGLASLLLAGLITYGVFSYLAWQGLREDSGKVSASFKQTIDSRLGTDKPTGTPLENVSAVIASFDDAYGDQPCAVSPLFSWQTIVPAAKDIQSSCQTNFANSLAAVADLKILKTFYGNQKTVSDLLIGASEATKTTADYVAAAAAWQAVADSSKLKITGDFKPAADKTKEVALAIATAFTTVKAGIDSEDRATFDAAITGLQAAYTNLTTVQQLINDQRAALVADYLKSYAKL